MDLTPNLSYCLSLAGWRGRCTPSAPAASGNAPPNSSRKGPASTTWSPIEIDDADRCPRYTAAVVTGVKVGPSPFWMQHRLRLAGTAADQQHRRHHQLRHVGDGPAAPRLRLRPASGGEGGRMSEDRRPHRTGGGEDHHPRRRRSAPVDPRTSSSATGGFPWPSPVSWEGMRRRCTTGRRRTSSSSRRASTGPASVEPPPT